MFEGNYKQLEGWITACQLKFTGEPFRFHNELSKAIFAPSVQNGPSKTWIQPLATAFLDKETKQKPEEFTSFEAFVKSIKNLYSDPNLD